MNRQPPLPASPARRDFIRTATLGAVAASLPALPFAIGSAHAQSTDIITRKIPRTGEVLPAIGLGTYLTFDVLPGKPRDNIREVIKRF